MILDVTKYADDDYLSKTNNMNILRVDNGTSENAEIRFTYQVEDIRITKMSIGERALNATGKLAWEVYDGELLKNPTLKLYYNKFGFPDSTTRMKKEYLGLFGKSTEVIHKKYHTAFVKDELGFRWIWEKSAL